MDRGIQARWRRVGGPAEPVILRWPRGLIGPAVRMNRRGRNLTRDHFGLTQTELSPQTRSVEATVAVGSMSGGAFTTFPEERSLGPVGPR
jgi:hypothetical protein